MTTMRERVGTLLARGLIPLFCFVAASPAGAQTCVQPPSGLVSWWPGDGNADDILGDHDGTLQGGATFAAGQVGQAFSFDGVDGLVNAPHLGIRSEMTVDAWVRINAGETADPYQTVFDNLGAPEYTNGMLISAKRVASDGRYTTLALYVSRNHEFTADNFYDIGRFTHIAITTKDGLTKAYKNGMLVGTFTLDPPQPLQSNSANTRFGGRLSGKEALRGQIDEVEVYNRELSQAEIQAIYSAGSAGKCKAPSAFDHFKCYTAKGTPPNVTVDLKDQFGVELGVVVREPAFYCNPVDKNGEGIRDLAVPLTCYKIAGESESRDVVVGNQFGRQTLAVTNPGLLCVPSNKN